MAKSQLIIRRKKSTVLVSVQTLQEAIKRANAVVEMLMKQNQNDPRMNKIEAASNHMSRILTANPQQMQHDGVSQISDYMDDAKSPAEARKLKQEVDMISQTFNELRGAGNAPTENPGVGYVPDSAVAEQGVHASQKEGSAAAFVTDRDEKGEAKAPEKLEVPRLAKKKKKEAEDPALDAAAPVPPTPPAPPVAEAAPAAPAPAAGGINAIDYIPTESLIKVIEDLPKEDDFAQNKNKQDALIELTNVLKARPVLPPEAPEGQAQAAPAAPAPSSAPALGGDASAAPLPVAASAKKADLGDHAMGQAETISDGSGASAEIGQGGTVSGGTPSPKSLAPDAAQPKAPSPFGGLSLSSALEEDKTADDYRIQDYKLTEEGIRPSGGLPTMDEQESGGHHSQQLPGMNEGQFDMESSMDKEAVTPPGISEELMHKLKSEYPGEKDKAYATAWKIHNEKEGSKQIEAAFEAGAHFAASQIAKAANAAAGGGGWFTSYKPMEVDEDGGRTPEIGEAHSKLEDNTGIKHPETTEPIKLNEQQGLKTGAKTAADLTTGKAVKESEQIGNDLKKMYLDAKSLTNVNDTRPVREAVEAIFRAADLFDEATKTLNKQHQQEESEAEAAKIKTENKGKKSSFLGLAVAAGE